MPIRPKQLKGERRPQHMQREHAAARGYGSRWQKARAGWLHAHPLCVLCEAAGLVVAGNEVDHIKPHKGDMALFWDSGNWQTLCKPCHSTKTVQEDGGFGNLIRNN